MVEGCVLHACPISFPDVPAPQRALPSEFNNPEFAGGDNPFANPAFVSRESSFASGRDSPAPPRPGVNAENPLFGSMVLDSNSPSGHNPLFITTTPPYLSSFPLNVSPTPSLVRGQPWWHCGNLWLRSDLPDRCSLDVLVQGYLVQ